MISSKPSIFPALFTSPLPQLRRQILTPTTLPAKQSQPTCESWTWPLKLSAVDYPPTAQIKLLPKGGWISHCKSNVAFTAQEVKYNSPSSLIQAKVGSTVRSAVGRNCAHSRLKQLFRQIKLLLQLCCGTLSMTVQRGKTPNFLKVEFCFTESCK